MIPPENQQNARRNDLALHWAQHSSQNWDVFEVDPEQKTGVCVQQNLGFEKALNQVRLGRHGMVLVLVPSLGDRSRTN